MNALRLGAMLLIMIGSLGLVDGSFSYRDGTRNTAGSSAEFAVGARRGVNVPIWVGVGAIVLGAVLLLDRQKRPA